MLFLTAHIKRRKILGRAHSGGRAARKPGHSAQKSLALLEEDNLIIRDVGSGTRICFHNYGAVGNMDMIVLIAPAKNPFFRVYCAFSDVCREKGSMLLYVENASPGVSENCLCLAI